MDASEARNEALLQQDVAQPDLDLRDRSTGGLGWLWALLFVGVLGGMGWFWFARGRNEAPPADMAAAPQGVQVELERVAPGLIQTTSNFVGSLEAAERVALQPEV
ncbi:MAG: hypothetical protein AAFX40_16205, partial [Cyanobacteria bacterium J06639_1]